MVKPEKCYNGFLPGQFPITAYGDGGFRFAEMSHRGSLLLLPSGIQAIEVQSVDDIAPNLLKKVVAEQESIEFFLIGTGNRLHLLPETLRAALLATGLRYEVMQTGAAIRTYNVLLAEDRYVAAVLLAF